MFAALRRSHVSAIALLCGLLLSPHPRLAARGQSGDEATLVALTRQYYESLAREDMAGAMRLWEPKSPDFRGRDGWLTPAFEAYEQADTRPPVLREMHVTADRAVLRVEVNFTAVNARDKTRTAALLAADRVIEWRRAGGGWRILREGSAATVELAAALEAAPSDAARRALVAARPDLLTVELWEDFNERGNRLFARDKFSEALAVYGFARELAERLGYAPGLFRALTNLGVAHRQLGNFLQTLDHYQRALALGEELNDRQSLARLHNNLGTFYRVQGDFGLSLKHCARAVELARAVGYVSGLATALSNLGTTYRATGREDEAMGAYLESLGHYRRLPQGERGVATALARIGTLHLFAGRGGEARASLEQSLALREQLKSASGLSECHNYLALLDAEQGKLEAATGHAQQAVARARESETRTLLWRALTTAGRLHRLARRYEQSHAALAEAIELIEQSRAQVAGDEEDQQRFFQQRFSETSVSAYLEMVELRLDQSQPALALAAAERAKARVLLDVMQGDRADLARVMAPDEQAEERRLEREMSALNRQIFREQQRPQPDASRLNRLEERRSRARLEHREFQKRLYARHAAALARDRQPRAPERLTAEQAAALLPSSGALLEFVATPAETYLFVLTRGQADGDSASRGTRRSSAAPSAPAKLQFHRLGVSGRELAARVGEFRARLARRDLRFREPARELYRLLIEPAAAQLTGVSSLVIVPDGTLWEMPFQALTTPQGRYLLEDAAISYAPSLTVLGDFAARRRGRRAAAETLLAFGNPALGPGAVGSAPAQLALRESTLGTLPLAEEEVKTVGRLYGAERSRIHVGAATTERTVKREAGKYRVLHFATHGVVSDDHPMHSFLVLSQADESGDDDGLLEAREIIKLDLRADLAVLSACETARGRVGVGEGLIGLSWAFWVAGCPTTVVSQWKVESGSTTALMADFHRQLLRRRDKTPSAAPPAAEALRGAALELMRREEYRHPFYWAGFVVMGE
jgi:CHAT domain-containing protein/tetratricopeptide (TPR) repeat protein